MVLSGAHGSDERRGTGRSCSSAGPRRPAPGPLRALVLVLLLCLASPALAAAWHFDDVPRVVAIGDVHGAKAKLVRVLRASGLVGEDLAWTGGRDHLVMLGDLIDRGQDDRAILDLVRRLQQEAHRAGGRVHVLLGNHEVMNLARDHRYVSPGGYAGFADLEDPTDRSAARRAFALLRPEGESPEAAENAFAAAYPTGYFGRLRAFGPGGVYAEWLLDQRVVVRINGVAFVHGGLTEQMAALGPDELNRRVPEQVRAFWKGCARLLGDGPEALLAGFNECQRAAATAARENGGKAERVGTEVLALFAGPAFAPDGPLWYRGLALEDERVEAGALEAVLEHLGAKALVVGHTTTGSRTVTSRFGGRLLRADTGLSKSSNPTVLIAEGGIVHAFDATLERHAPPRPEPPLGEAWAGDTSDMPDLQLEDFLETAEVTAMRLLGRGSTRPQLLELHRGAVRRRGIFKAQSERPAKADAARPLHRWQHEVAAYRLDRLLGFGLVPVTVERELDGQRGSLQDWAEKAVHRAAAREFQLTPATPDVIERQLGQVRLFDALIGNTARHDDDILFQLQHGRVLLVDHGSTFPLEADVAAILGPEPCRIDPLLRRSLARMHLGALLQQLGKLLAREQIDAILKRRDALLKTCAEAPATPPAPAAVPASAAP